MYVSKQPPKPKITKYATNWAWQGQKLSKKKKKKNQVKQWPDENNNVCVNINIMAELCSMMGWDKHRIIFCEKQLQ